MKSYLTTKGERIDLSTLTDQQAAYLARGVDLYRAGADSREFTAFIHSGSNPLQVAAKRFPDAVMWHPLIQALHDLEFRLSVAQGRARPASDDNLEGDPFAVA